jgi:hypothetical protein
MQDRQILPRISKAEQRIVDLYHRLTEVEATIETPNSVRWSPVFQATGLVFTGT